METQEKFTKLLKTDIIAVEVPRDATDISLGSLGHALYFSQKSKIKHINLPFGKVEILGEATEYEISFDVEPYVEKKYFNVEGRKLTFFKDYNPLKKILHDIYSFANKNQSFRSLLQASGLNWVNPIEKPKGTNLESSFFEMQVDFNQEKLFEEAESKLIKGKLIFLKIVK